MFNNKISGLSDEISSEIDVQFEVLNKLGIKYYEPRFIDGKNISELNDEEIVDLKSKMDKAGIKALEKGKTVVCEKPLVMTKAEMDEFLKLENSDKVATVFQNRLTPCIIKAKEVVESGTYGKIIAAKSQVTWKRTKEYYSDDWHGKMATEGGVLINQAIHTFDYFYYIMGGIESLKAKMMNFALDIEVEDTFVAGLKLKCGAEALFFASNAYGISTKPEFEIVLENGVMQFKDDVLYLNGKLVAENSKKFLGKAYWGIGHIRLFKIFTSKTNTFLPKM